MADSELVSIISLILSCFSSGLTLYLYVKFAKPQAQLATIKKEEILNQRLFNHRQELKKWFFEKIKEDLVGYGTLSENAVFEGAKTYIEKLKMISKRSDLEDHWKNGMKHLEIDDDANLYNLLNSIESTMMDLDERTEQLNKLIEEKINELIEPTQSVDQFNYLSRGKIVKRTLLDLIENELVGFLTRCSREKGDSISCLKNQSASNLDINDQGYIVKDNTSVAMPSSDLRKEDVEYIIDTVEKDDELLKKMIKIRKERALLRDKFVEIRDRCTTIIEKIDKGTYHTVAECCSK